MVVRRTAIFFDYKYDSCLRGLHLLLFVISKKVEVETNLGNSIRVYQLLLDNTK